jgi:hypothetical protein
VGGESGTDDDENVEIFLFVCSRRSRDKLFQVANNVCHKERPC